jgi:hypothetical protein
MQADTPSASCPRMYKPNRYLDWPTGLAPHPTARQKGGWDRKSLVRGHVRSFVPVNRTNSDHGNRVDHGTRRATNL